MTNFGVEKVGEKSGRKFHKNSSFLVKIVKIACLTFRAQNCQFRAFHGFYRFSPFGPIFHGF